MISVIMVSVIRWEVTLNIISATSMELFQSIGLPEPNKTEIMLNKLFDKWKMKLIFDNYFKNINNIYYFMIYDLFIIFNFQINKTYSSWDDHD